MKTIRYSSLVYLKKLSNNNIFFRSTRNWRAYAWLLMVVAATLVSMTTGRKNHITDPSNLRVVGRESLANTPPQPTANVSQTVAVGVGFSYTVNAFTDTETPNKLTYSASITPAYGGFMFDETTRILSGTASRGGIIRIIITATDPGGLSASTSFSITIPCSTHPDYAAMVDFYNATNGPNWTTKTNWLTSCSPCDWYGVTCGMGERVAEIRLSNNGLSGSLPSSLSALSLFVLELNGNKLSGSVPAPVGKLTNLQLLSLSNNQLSGPIPTQLANMGQLEDLYLDNNQLTGPIPLSLTTNTYLAYLDLSANQLTGPIPPSLGTMNRLQYLVLSHNQLSGSIPASLGNMPYSWGLYLDHNQLSGSIPGNIGYDVYEYGGIDLSYNQLTGTIPDSLGMGRLRESLRNLRLNNNKLTGSIPASLANLTNLQDLHLDHNQLSGCFPVSLSALCGKTVDVSNNPKLPNGGNFALFCANGTGQCPTQPDLTPVLYARPTIIDGVNGITVVVNVMELNDVAMNGPVTLKLTKDPSLNLVFLINATVVGDRPVNNSDWTFANADPDYYVLTSKQPLTAGGSLSVGLSGKFSAGTTAGSLTISAVLVNIADEYRVTNNSDADKVEYWGQ